MLFRDAHGRIMALQGDREHLPLILVNDLFLDDLIGALMGQDTVARFDVGNRSRTLIRRHERVRREALVHIARGVIEVAQHRHDSIGGSIGSADQRSFRADVVDVESDATCVFTDQRTVFQSVIDSSDRVPLNFQEKAAAKLLSWSPRIEVRGGRVNEIFLAQEVIGLKRLLQTDGSPQRKGDTHEKILGALQRLPLRVTKQILELFQCLEPEIVKEMVALMADLLVDRVTVKAAQINEFLRDRAGVLSRFLHHLIGKSLHHIREAVRGILVMVRDGQSRRKRTIIGMGRHQRDGELSSEFI